MTSTPTQALVIAFDGIEEIEALTPVDILRRAQIEVTIASVNESISVKGRNQISFSTDTTLSQINIADFNLLILPGGPGVLELLDDESVRDILLAQDKAGKEIAAICAAPKILAHHGILDSRNATSHISVRADLPHPSQALVESDKHITTSQGLGTAVEFSLALVEKLKGKETAQQIADSIHFYK